MHKAKESLKPTYGAYSTELGAETTVADAIVSATYVDMRDYDLVIAYAHVTNVVATHVITLQLYEGTSTAGAASATLAGHTDTFTSTNLTDTDLLQAEARGEDLSDNYRYVGARVTTDDADGDEIVGLILVQGRPRYAQNGLP